MGRLLGIITMWSVSITVLCYTAWTVTNLLFLGNLHLNQRDLAIERSYAILACSQMAFVLIGSNSCLTVLILCRTLPRG
jgi:hypothetical protein